MVLNRTLSTAPMMDWSDRHCRYMWRKLTRHTLLYTEMVTSAALQHADNPARFMDFNPEEQPLALQLGGSDPKQLYNAAVLAERWGYREVNLNVGCPSDRVQNGMIGAILMAYPEKVRDAWLAMSEATGLPVTLKHRIGLDREESYDFVRDFVGVQYSAGCRVFIVHARNAILKGLSPRQNREIPPLRYDIVYHLKQDFPDCEIILNGGVQDLDEARTHLQQVDGVMLGRAAYYRPMLLSGADQLITGGSDTTEALSAAELLAQMIPYVKRLEESGEKGKYALQHLLNVPHGLNGSKAFRTFLSQNMHSCSDCAELLENALPLLEHKKTE